MNATRYILVVSFMMFSLVLIGQKKISKGKVVRQSPVSLLKMATELSTEHPTKSIFLIEDLLTRKEDKVLYDVLDEAYFLLGTIYEDIGQNELAIQRYEQALSYIGKGDENRKAIIYYKIGNISLQLNDPKKANFSFDNCLQWAVGEDLIQKCESGKIDVLIQEDSNVLALNSIIELESKNANDSITIVRLESRKSQVYSQMNDFENAAISIQNVYNAMPSSVTLPNEDIDPLTVAQDKLFNSMELSNAKKIELQGNFEYNNQNVRSNIARENFRISEVYEAENDDSGVLSSIENSKRYIDDSADAELIAKVYKKSYEYNLKSGRSQIAFNDLDRYVKAKEQVMVELEADLKEEIEIVKSQKRIDLSQSDLQLQEKERALMQSQLKTQKTWIGLLSLLFGACLVFFYFLNRNIKAKKRANQLLELKSLRTQMNPHFIFNALNSVNNFISKNDEKSANKYLSEFSHLMRMVLDYSKQDFISLREEIELNELYLKLEHFRFRDKFDYDFINKVDATYLDTKVPPMLIQPFIENAVWHGLRYKENKGHLKVTFEQSDDVIQVVIVDDGIGRVRSKALKTKNQLNHKSTGLNNVINRLIVLNKAYGQNFEVEVVDLYPDQDDTGTKAILKIPIKRHPENND